jgi:hypothetical protein
MRRSRDLGRLGLLAAGLGTGSTADAGSDAPTAGNFDLAAVFGDALTATATSGSFVADIAP